MVAAVRRGQPLRRVARRFGVSLCAVQYWVQRTQGQRLSRVDWSDRPRGCRISPQRIEPAIEDLVLRVRQELRQHSDLGEYGAAAIARALAARDLREPPALRTIGRILWRRGALDARQRVRRAPPPPGWYLPAVAQRRAELDSFDLIVDLTLRGGPPLQILNGISLHGRLCMSWPRPAVNAPIVGNLLLEHWRAVGLPSYVQFDNDTIFQGARIKPDTFGRVTRLCLSLGLVPVFAPPREHGFQNAIESFNARWEAKVFRRFEHPDLAALQDCTRRFVAAARERAGQAGGEAPPRRAFPKGWNLDLQRPLAGQVIFLRRSDARGQVQVLGHSYPAGPNWLHRLVRAEVDLSAGCVRLYGLRRREPTQHALLGEHTYQVPGGPFHE